VAEKRDGANEQWGAIKFIGVRNAVLDSGAVKRRRGVILASLTPSRHRDGVKLANEVGHAFGQAYFSYKYRALSAHALGLAVASDSHQRAQSAAICSRSHAPAHPRARTKHARLPACCRVHFARQKSSKERARVAGVC